MTHKSRPFLIAGNWKMNLSIQNAENLTKEAANWALHNDIRKVELLICPAYVHILRAIRTDEAAILQIGAQNCSAEDNGAHTGDISAAMLKDMGCHSVILGHSERRMSHNETSALVHQKAEKAIAEGLDVIICIGETLEQRESGQEKQAIQKQLEESVPMLTANGENCVIAYEPIWAIGTGKTASPADVQEMHSFINDFLSSRLAKPESLRIIYGGSVKPDNAKDLMALPYVSGALIGGASLKADSYLAIADAAYAVI